MSPEQASAHPALDARSDVYALACVLYEMLTGHPPFQGRTSQEILPRHAVDTTGRPEIPPVIEAAVLRALAKAPADRFATTSGFTDALALPSPTEARVRSFRPALVVVTGLALLVAVALLMIRPWRSDPAQPSVSPTIAVMAFSNLGGDPENEPFSDGIADELTTALGNVEGLSVRPAPRPSASRTRDCRPGKSAAASRSATWSKEPCDSRDHGGG